jgi:hypothetical protein
MRPVIVSILMLMSGLSAWSQTDRLDSLLTDVLGDDKEMMRLLNPPSSYCYLYAGIAGDSKSYYAGREIDDNMVNMSGNIYFFHSKGFFIGTSGSWYSQVDPGYSTTIVTAGISRAINQKKSLLFRTSYSRYFYNDGESDTTVHVFNNNLGTGLSIRNKWIGGRLSLNLLFGQEFGMNITPNVFSRIPLARIGKYNKIQLEPELSMFFGSESVEYNVSGNMGGMQGSQSSTDTDVVYGLLNTQFYLPVCIYLGDFDIELGYSLNIPTTQDQDSYPISSFISFSLGYLLPLN